MSMAEVVEADGVDDAKSRETITFGERIPEIFIGTTANDRTAASAMGKFVRLPRCVVPTIKR